MTMRTFVGPKPQYRWRDGHFQELVHDLEHVLATPAPDTYIACWNDYAQVWEFGRSDGRHIDRVWRGEHLPAGFRAGLLLVGVRT